MPISPIARAVAGRNVHAPAERDSKVGEIAADAALLHKRAPGTLGRVGVLVTEADMSIHVVADCLHPRPARRRFLK